MGQRILVATPFYFVRRGLREFFLHEEKNAFVEEADSPDVFVSCLASHPYNVIVVHQEFLIGVSLSPGRRIIVLASEPSKELFLAAREHYAIAYLRDNPSEHLLREVLRLESGAFMLDPVFHDWIYRQLSEHGNPHIPMELLTEREREVAELRNKGLSYAQIGRQLHIEVSTVRQHVVNIGRKIKKVQQ